MVHLKSALPMVTAACPRESDRAVTSRMSQRLFFLVTIRFSSSNHFPVIRTIFSISREGDVEDSQVFSHFRNSSGIAFQLQQQWKEKASHPVLQPHNDPSLIGLPLGKLVCIRAVMAGIFGRAVEPGDCPAFFINRIIPLVKNCTAVEFDLLADQLGEDQLLGCLELEDGGITQK
ncbi:hypothetical protein BV898_20147, partial [Hypsibius exemplaris]